MNGETSRAQNVNLSAEIATDLGVTNVEEAIAYLATVRTVAQTEKVTLASLIPDTWTDFPVCSFDYTDWKIYKDGIEISNSFAYRLEDGDNKIASSISYTNLEFVFFD